MAQSSGSQAVSRSRRSVESPSSRGRSSTAEMILLAIPPVVAIFNPGTGLLSGFYMSILVFVYAFIRYGRRIRISTIDVLAFALSVILILSPAWTVDLGTTDSEARGAAASVLYYISVRWMVRRRSDFIKFAELLAVVTFAYASYFLVYSQAYDIDAYNLGYERAGVQFANPNYTGAILAFGVAVTSFLAFAKSRAKGAFWLLMTGSILQVLAITQTGSRASLAGGCLALLIVAFGRKISSLVRTATGVMLAVGFFIGFVPRAADFFRYLSQVFAGESSFSRDEASLLTLSGREYIWDSTRDIIHISPWLGSGPEKYRLLSDTQILAHSWGLEYMASVGLVGMLLIFGIVLMSYYPRPGVKRYQFGQYPNIWNAATVQSRLLNIVWQLFPFV